MKMIKQIECTVSDIERPAQSERSYEQVAYVRRRKTSEKQSGILKFAAGTYRPQCCPPAIFLNTLA